VSLFKSRRVAPAAQSRPPVADDGSDEIEGVTLGAFAAFVTRIGGSGVPVHEHEQIARDLGFPDGRFDLIRNAWLSRVYASPALAQEFGKRLDEARALRKNSAR
jgi:hypothetical protein